MYIPRIHYQDFLLMRLRRRVVLLFIVTRLEQFESQDIDEQKVEIKQFDILNGEETLISETMNFIIRNKITFIFLNV